MDKRFQKLQEIVAWEARKPRSNAAWAEDVKAESLDIKRDEQLEEMEKSHVDKLPRVEKDLDKFINWPDVVRYELTQQFTQMFENAAVDGMVPETVEGKTLQEWIDEEFDSQKLMYEWKVAKLRQSVERIKKERQLRASEAVIRKARE